MRIIISKKKKQLHNTNEKLKLQALPIQEKKPVVFSFSKLISDKRYGKKAFLNNGRCKITDLLEKLEQMSRLNIVDLLNKPKNSGLEVLPVWKFAKVFQNAVLSKDAKLYVARFGQQNFRIIMEKEPNSDNVLNILGFDFDFSAYDHGN